LSLQQKQSKLLQYGSAQNKEEGKIIDDELDEQAEIEMNTITTVMKYYGHWSRMASLIGIELFL